MEIGISVVGPSGSGKTSLLTSIFEHTRKIVDSNSSKKISIYPADDDTKENVAQAAATFNRCINNNDSLEFVAAEGTKGVQKYTYSFKFGSSEDLDINITDYPGGWLANSGFENVKEQILTSSAVLVPIPSDLLLHLMSLDPNRNPDEWERCYIQLGIDNVLSVLNRWINTIVEKGAQGYLVFVPIRCEHCFTDNINRTCSEKFDIFDAVKEHYISRIEFNDQARKSINVAIHAVDTYGITKLRIVDYEVIENQATGEISKKLKSTFNVTVPPSNKRVPTPKGSFELLSNIIKQTLEVMQNSQTQILKENRKIHESRRWYKKFWEKIFGSKTQKNIDDVTANLDALKSAYMELEEISNHSSTREKRILENDL